MMTPALLPALLVAALAVPAAEQTVGPATSPDPAANAREANASALAIAGQMPLAPPEGAQVVYHQAPPVEQVYPPPPPRDTYPVCSATVRDSCRNAYDPN